MASSKPKTTMNKLNRERKVREKRLDKAARKIRRQTASAENPVDEFGNRFDEFGNRIDEFGNRIDDDDNLETEDDEPATASTRTEMVAETSQPSTGS